MNSSDLTVGIISLLFGALSLLPRKLAHALVFTLFSLVLVVVPRFKRIARRNLEIAFPEKDSSEREQILRGSVRSFVRLIVDTARMSRLDREWVTEHIKLCDKSRYAEILKSRGEKGVLIVTGHLGSFELIAHSHAILFEPMSFIVRDLPQEGVNRWIKEQRESNGNTVISRTGAYRNLVQALRKGKVAGLLFDQNVTKNHAVFVDLFGTKAATTKTVALAALQTRVPVVVASIEYLGDDDYRIVYDQCKLEDIFSNQELDRKDKIRLITERVSSQFEEMIRKNPEGWFWMHRRWKTRPEGEPESLYK